MRRGCSWQLAPGFPCWLELLQPPVVFDLRSTTVARGMGHRLVPAADAPYCTDAQSTLACLLNLGGNRQPDPAGLQRRDRERFSDVSAGTAAAYFDSTGGEIVSARASKLLMGRWPLGPPRAALIARRALRAIGLAELFQTPHQNQTGEKCSAKTTEPAAAI